MSWIALVAICLGGDDLAESRRALLDAIENANDTKGAEAAAKIAALDSKEALDALLKGYGACLSTSDELEKRKAKLVKTMEDKGKDPKSGAWRDYTGFIKARDELVEVNAKIGRVEWIRLSIAKAFPKFQTDAAVKELVSRLKGDASVRGVVVAALARVDHPDVLPALKSALKGERDAGVKVALLDALGAKRSKDREVVAAVCDALKDEFWQVKCAAAGALKAIGSLDAVEPLIEAVKSAEGRVLADFNAALAGLTGVDKHSSYDAWKAWWAENKEAVLAGAYKPTPAERARGAGGTTFYGVPIVSKKFAFVIDRSGSMADKAKWKPDDSVATGGGPAVPDIKLTGDRKIDVARYELKRALSMLSDGVEFTIVFYNREIEVISDKVLVNGRETRARVFAQVDTYEPSGQTNISDALERGLSFAAVAEKLAKGGIDTIYLLSDGYPTAGIVDGTQLRSRIAEVNRLRKVAIHTIAIEPGADSEALMKAIARENSGTYAKR